MVALLPRLADGTVRPAFAAMGPMCGSYRSKAGIPLRGPQREEWTMSRRTETMRETDAVELLVRQHEEIRRLLGEVDRKKGAQRAAAFERLRRLLAVHETAEEEIVHPLVRRSLDNGDSMVDARLQEENEGKRMLCALETMGPSAAGFDALFGEFREAVLRHAEKEEREEFPALSARSGGELQMLALAIRAAEATAPTHPHPGVESATANLLAGPFAAVADRTRDAIRRILGRDGG
jgi:hemerythrin superfamily protein